MLLPRGGQHGLDVVCAADSQDPPLIARGRPGFQVGCHETGEGAASCLSSLSEGRDMKRKRNCEGKVVCTRTRHFKIEPYIPQKHLTTL